MGVSEPLAIWPEVLLPQQVTVPSASSAQVWVSPAARATAPVKPRTGTAVFESVMLQLPSCPSLLLPQQDTAPPASKAQLWVSPAVTAVAPVTPAVATGIEY